MKSCDLKDGLLYLKEADLVRDLVNEFHNLNPRHGSKVVRNFGINQYFHKTNIKRLPPEKIKRFSTKLCCKRRQRSDNCAIGNID